MHAITHILEADLLNAARLPEQLGPEALEHLTACSLCQRHLEILQAGVEASLENTLEPIAGEDPEEAIVQWLTSTDHPSSALRQRLEHPAERLLSQRVAMDLKLLGAQDLAVRLAEVGMVLPKTWSERHAEDGVVQAATTQEPSPARMSIPATAVRSDSAAKQGRSPFADAWRRLTSAWETLWPSPTWRGLALASLAVLLMVGLGRSVLHDPPGGEGFKVRGGPASTLSLNVAATVYRPAPDGLWDPVGGGASGVLSCEPGDRLGLLVSGEGTGVLSLWRRADGGALQGPLVVQKRSLNSAQLSLLPEGESSDALGMQLPTWNETLEVLIAFSAEPPPRFFRERWLEKLTAAPTHPAVSKLLCRRAVPKLRAAD